MTWRVAVSATLQSELCSLSLDILKTGLYCVNVPAVSMVMGNCVVFFLFYIVISYVFTTYNAQDTGAKKFLSLFIF